MAGKDNLKRFSSEEARENGKKGAIARTKSYARKRAMKELANSMLNANANDEEKKRIARAFPDFEPEDITQQAVIISSQIEKAKIGDVKSAEFVRDTSGQQIVKAPVNTIQEAIEFLKMCSPEEIQEIIEGFKNDE